jgi:HPt (histidine-containing phosphotransfer) domain-containing protein
MTGGTESGYRKVLSQFRKDALERLSLLQKPPEPDVLPVFVTQVHAIKSAAGTIGAVEVSRLAAELEAAGKAGDIETIPKTLPLFREHLTELIEGIQKNLTTNNTNSTNGEQDNSAYKETVVLLKSALETKNMKEIDKLLEEIEKMPLDEKTRETVNAVSDKVLMGEYREAVELIGKCINESEGGIQ